MKTSELFEKELGYIKNDILREITKRTLDDAPPCFKVIPASSSGKYHPMYAIKRGEVSEDGNVDKGGLVLHTLAAVNIAHSIMQTKYFMDVINNIGLYDTWEDVERDKERCMDIVYAALLCHDTQKPDDTPQHNTKFEHPIDATKVWMKNVVKVLESYELSFEQKESMREISINVARCIGSHMGEFNKSKYSDVVLPTPITSIEWFVHLCDFLASRRFLEFNFEAFAEVGR